MNCQKNYFFLALAFFSTSVWALTDQGSGYTGTYEIRTCQDMVDFANIVRGEGFNQNTKANAKVMNAINMTCTSEYPKIGRQNDTYTGTFDGQNYPIKGLKLTSGDQNVGLFAAIGEGAYLKNFVVQDVEITGTVSRPTDGTGDIGSIGGLVGWQNGGTIEGCYVSGTVTGTGRENAVGGIVGNSYNGEIRDCYSHVTVRATGELSFAGGLVGYAYRPCATWEDNFGVTVYSSVFDGSVFATDPTSYAGGVTGNNGERRPFAPDPKEYHDNTNCSQNLTDWDHDYFINDFYDANSADYGVGTGTNADWASYPNNNGGSENNFTKTNVPETFDMDSRHTICLLNEGTWNAETETCENQKSDVWSGGEGGISNGAGVFENGVAKYLIAFDPNGGKYPSGAKTSKNLEMGAAINADNITNPYRRFYTFKGWATSKDASSPSSLGNVAGTKTIYAVWEAATTETLKVYFNKVVGNVTVLDSITVTVNIPADTSEAKQIAAINNAFAAMDPAVVVAKVGGNEDSIYTHDSWARNKDASGKPVFDASGNVTYEPTFTAVLANTLVAQYGSGTGDSILVKVPAADSEADRIAKIMDAIASHDPEINVEKTGGSSDSVYTYSGWQIKKDGSGTAITDGSGNVIYEPTFDVEVKKETIVARFGTDDDDTVLVEVHVTDNDETRFDKIEATLASHDPAITPKKDSTETTVYEYNGAWVQNASGEYEPQFDESARKYEVTLNVPTGATVIPAMTKYAAGTAATLPSANLDGWTFSGWVDGSGTPVTQIAADATGDKAYTAVFTKNITVVYGDGTEDKLTVTIEQDDSETEIVEKIEAALEAENITPTKESSATTDYTYNGEWVQNTSGEYVAQFDESAREYTVTLNVPDGATVIPAMTKYAAGTAATLPSANLDGWTFSGWVDGSGTPVTQIAADATGDKAYTAVFTKNITVVYGEGAGDNLTVEIEQDDSAAEIVEKIEAALEAENITPSKSADADSTYEFNGKWNVDGNTFTAEFEGTLITETVIVKYGEGDGDQIEVIVPKAANDSVRTAVVMDSLQNKGITPAKASDADSTYEFNGKWNVDGNTFTAEFEGTLITETVIVKYGDGAEDQIEVIVPKAANDFVRTAVVMDSLESKGITPTKSADADSTYEFNGKWDVDGNTFTAEFEGSPKYIEVVVGDDTVKVVIPDTTSGTGSADSIVVEVKVVVDGDTVMVPVIDGDILDSAAKKVLDSIPTKEDTADSTYEFAGWEQIKDSTGKPIVDENGNEIYEPVFEAELKGEIIVVSTGDSLGSTIEVVIKVNDSDDEIQEAIKKAFEDNGIALPSKSKEGKYAYTFNKFVRDTTTGRFVPDFARDIIFNITFIMPKNAELTEEFNGYVFGKKTALPEAFIVDGEEWEFKGWYTNRKFNGDRVKMMVETDYGDKVLYPFFQKTVYYSIGDEKGEVAVLYDENSEKNVARALDRISPEDYEKDGVTYTFSKWVLENDVYVAKFTEATSVRQVVAPRFSVSVLDRTLAISGARKGSKIAVYDMRGQLKATGVVMNGTQLLELDVPGSYIVRVNNQSTRVNIR